MAFLEKNGVTINKISDLDAMKEKTATVVTDWTAKDPLVGRLVDALKAGD
jgi:TRAP-type C4-dicarboxylate transport system substrate-binding protein